MVLALVVAVILIVQVAVPFLQRLFFDPQEALQVRYTPLANGQQFSQGVTMVAPYGAKLPEIEPGNQGGYCLNMPQELHEQGGVYLGAFARVVLQNKGDAEFGSLQVSALRTEVVDVKDAPAGVLVGCQNSGGDVPIVATTEAVDGYWASMELEASGEIAPVAFVLDPGEQQVVDLIINPASQDVTMNVVVDYVHDNEQYSEPFSATLR